MYGLRIGSTGQTRTAGAAALISWCQMLCINDTVSLFLVTDRSLVSIISYKLNNVKPESHYNVEHVGQQHETWSACERNFFGKWAQRNTIRRSFDNDSKTQGGNSTNMPVILPWSLDDMARAELLSSSFTSAFSCSLSLTNISKCSCRGRHRVVQNNKLQTI